MAEALETVGMSGFANRTFSTLSGGEQQRVILARALAQQTPGLILDEPTNHLDIKYQLQLMDLVRGLDRTVIAAVHDLNIAAMYCDRLYAVKGGQIVGTGSPRELLTPDFIREVYEVDPGSRRTRTASTSSFTWAWVGGHAHEKIGVLTCLDACRVCAGVACLNAWNGRERHFARYAGEDACLTAFFHCGGCGTAPCSDAGMLEKLDRLQSNGVETVHIGVCAVKDREAGTLCPVMEEIQGMLHDRGVQTILGTH